MSKHHRHLFDYRRREALRINGASGAAAALVGCTGSAQSTLNEQSLASIVLAPYVPPTQQACVVSAAQVEGPYFNDAKLERADVRSDPRTGVLRAGVPLELNLQLNHVSNTGCAPIVGAIVDIWQCDAHGAYSAFNDPRAGGDLRSQHFLRGYQTSDTQGRVRFQTIYPGWYSGRAVHIHFKVRTQPQGARGHEFTSQLYFNESLTDQIHATRAYLAHGTRDMRNERDFIFRRGGEALTLTVQRVGEQLRAEHVIGVRAG